MYRSEDEKNCIKCLEALRQKEFDSAKEYKNILEERSTSNPRDSNLRMLANLTGGAYFASIGNSGKGIRLLNNAINSARIHINKWYLIEIKRYLAICLLDSGSYERALIVNNEAIELLRHNGETDFRLMSNLCATLVALNELHEAERLYIQLLKYHKNNKDIIGQVIIYNNLAALYNTRATRNIESNSSANKELVLAVEYGRKALSTLAGNGGIHIQLTVKANLVCYECFLNKELINIEVIHEVIRFNRNVKNFLRVSQWFNYLSQIYLHCDEYTQAINYALEAVKIAEENNLKEKKKEALLQLSKAYEKNDDIQLSLNSLKEYLKLLSIDNQELLSKAVKKEELESRLNVIEADLINLNAFKVAITEVVDNLSQGIVIFDEDNNIIFENKIWKLLSKEIPSTDNSEVTSSTQDDKKTLHYNQNGILLAKHPFRNVPNEPSAEFAMPHHWAIATQMTTRTENSNHNNLINIAQTYNLKPQEVEILERLSKGESTADICEHLSLKIRTLRHYLSIIFKKLGVTNQREAVALVMK